MKTDAICYCGGSCPFDVCCGRFLTGSSYPRTPEALMRSRYTAFCMNDAEYLVKTLHPSKRQTNDKMLFQNTFSQTRWLGLKMIDAPMVKPGINEGIVEFAAFYQAGIQKGQLHEISRFIREENIWYYLDGHIQPPLTFKRNEPCWCGSGKKYKKCHGRSPLEKVF